MLGMSYSLVQLTVLCWVLIAAGVLNAAETIRNSPCRKKCSANPDSDPCENPAPAFPRFLLAGQSNAQGFSEQALNGLFNMTIEIVNGKFQEPLPTNAVERKERKKAIIAELRSAFGEAKGAKKGSSTYMARTIYKLAGRKKRWSVLNNNTILAPHPNVLCSFSNPKANKTIDCERKISAIDGETCGGRKNNFYGPELMFAHKFRKLKTKYKKKRFGITKVGVGGTKISAWLQNSGSEPNYWFSLQDNIRADNGTIEAFFWFQGENDHFETPTPQDEYFESLKNLVNDVRGELFKAHRARWGEEGSPTARFKSHKHIPVVIFELGPWIGNKIAERQCGESPGSVILAQRQFVAQDPNSILVNTGTNEDKFKRLSGFYHFDAPSQLIIGHRLAKSFKELLDTIEERNYLDDAAESYNTMPDDNTMPNGTKSNENGTAFALSKKERAMILL